MCSVIAEKRTLVVAYTCCTTGICAQHALKYPSSPSRVSRPDVFTNTVNGIKQRRRKIGVGYRHIRAVVVCTVATVVGHVERDNAIGPHAGLSVCISVETKGEREVDYGSIIIVGSEVNLRPSLKRERWVVLNL